MPTWSPDGAMKAEPAARPHGFSTRAVHAGSAPPRPGEPVVTPIVPSSTFFTEPIPEGEVRYTRYGTNPNHIVVAEKLAALEGAEAALALGSGMAATAMALLALAAAGDHIVAARSLYGGTLQLLTAELPRLGIETTFLEAGAEWSAAIRPRTRALLLEVPVNPTLRVPDLPALARLAAEHGVPLLVDATFATPVNLRPLEHGATLVIHSGTKYLGGHSDLTAGVVAGPAELVEEVRGRMKSFGPVLDPHACWLLERGLKTLPLRVARQNATAHALAARLGDHPAVERVHYPGLASHPDHERAARLLDGFGGMVGVVVRGGDSAALRVLSRLTFFLPAPSLGGVESLISMPRFTSHAGMSDAARRELGIDPGFLRLSVGLEEESDLWHDLRAALDPEAA
jgi:cystathionine beta-lyase/cystathionine gamma-synthase